MSRGKQREPFEGARRSGGVEGADTLKLTHKLTGTDEADVIQAEVLETAKGFPAVDWSIDDDLVIELPDAVAPALAVTPDIELDHKVDFDPEVEFDHKVEFDYKIDLDHKDVISIGDELDMKEQVVFEQPDQYLAPVEDLALKFDGVDGVDGESSFVGHKVEIDFDAAPVFEEFDSQWSAGVESASGEMNLELDGLVDLADPIDLQGFDG